MTPEQILEIARRYGNSDLRWVPVFENDEDIGISKREYVWEISQDSLIAFAQSVIDSERETRKLTDEEIGEIVREASSGSALRRDGSTSLRIARAIERRINREEE